MMPGGGSPAIYSRLNPPANYNLQLPCGQCIGCKLDRVTQWATRCLHESQLHEKTCALTLSYSDDSNYNELHQDRPGLYTSRHVYNPEDARELSTIAPKGLTEPNIARVGNSRSRPREVQLSKKDHQKFIKRLRSKIGVPVRYYMCGEYGDKLQRPHYHYLIFGYDFPDKKYFKKSLSGTPLFRSAELETLWTEGHSWIGQVDYATCAYVASYVMKKMNGKKAEEHYRRTDEAGNDYWLQPEFNYMSRNPGIAKDWWMKFHQDVTTEDVVYRGSTPTKPPRYYDKLLELLDPNKFLETKALRIANKPKEEDTPARLEAKEIVATARINLKQRQYER